MSPQKAKLAPTPKRLATEWRLDDVVQVGSVRWAIRILNPDGHVELEALNVQPGIWWTTTLDNLPTSPDPNGARP